MPADRDTLHFDVGLVPLRPGFFPSCRDEITSIHVLHADDFIAIAALRESRPKPSGPLCGRCWSVGYWRSGVPPVDLVVAEEAAVRLAVPWGDRI